jgi:26S proteasome regulatory subunit N1
MAKEVEKKPTAAEKGKAKAPLNNDADKDTKKDKDGKPDSEDKKGVATTGGMFYLWESCDGRLYEKQY